MWGVRMIFVFRLRLDYMTDDEFVNFVERNIVTRWHYWKVENGYWANASFRSKTVTVRYKTDDIKVGIEDTSDTVRKLQKSTTVNFCSISTQIRGGSLLYDKNGFLQKWVELKPDSDEAIDYACKFYKKKREFILELRDRNRRHMEDQDMPF